MIRKSELAALKRAQGHLDSFLAASRGDASRCGTFDPRAGMQCHPFTAEQKRQIRIYVESWIKEPLDVAIKAIEGDRTWDNEEALNQWSRR